MSTLSALKRTATLVGIFSLAAACSSAAPVTPVVDAGPGTPPHPLSFNMSMVTTNELALRTSMRQLWTDHVAWTRIYIIDAIAGLPETSATNERLLENQDAIGDAMKPFYGNAAAAQLTRLLRTHIVDTGNVVTALKSGVSNAGGDSNAVTTAKAAWYANADDIAKFLAGLNPNWSLADLTAHMHAHLDRTLLEIVWRNSANWAYDVSAYDDAESQILTFADFLTTGLVGQFPETISASPILRKDEDLQITMRKLWEEHVLWMHVYLVDQTSGLPDAPFAASRLNQNQVDIGNAMKPFYGDAVGAEMTSLLQGHVAGAFAVLAALESGDESKISTAKTAWYHNGDQLAQLLDKENPYWPFASAQANIRRHLSLTEYDFLVRTSQQWQGIRWGWDVGAYDDIVAHILTFSDFLAGGITKQFAPVLP